MKLFYRADAGSGKFSSRKVKILERAETMDDALHAPNALGKRYASSLDRVTLCYVRFGLPFLDSPFSPQP